MHRKLEEFAEQLDKMARSIPLAESQREMNLTINLEGWFEQLATKIRAEVIALKLDEQEKTNANR